MAWILRHQKKNMHYRDGVHGPWYFNSSKYFGNRNITASMCSEYDASKGTVEQITAKEKLRGIQLHKPPPLTLSLFDEKYLSIWKVERDVTRESDRCAGAIPLKCECLRYGHLYIIVFNSCQML